MSFVTINGWQVYDPTGQRKYVTADETDRFLLVADGFAQVIKAFCYVLVYTGARISEALELTRDQIDTYRKVLVFRTLKQRRIVFRAVPVPAMLIAMLLALPVAEDGRLFPFSRITAWRRVKDAMMMAQIRGPCSTARGLRHGFGMCAAGKSIPQGLIARWMGHSQLSTTSIYLDAVGSEERGFAERMW